MNTIDGNTFVKQSKNVFTYFYNDFVYISRIRFDGNNMEATQRVTSVLNIVI